MRLSRLLVLFAMASAFGTTICRGDDAAESPIKVKEFIYTSAPFPSCHASTLAQEADGTIVAAWFGGQYERAPDVAIWTARLKEGKWSAPQKVADASDQSGHGLPTWNPVLFQPPKGDLLLFYKAGPSPAAWWGMITRSRDGGVTWAKPRRLPDGILGPIKNKPILLSNGVLLCPSSDESDGWKLKIERTSDLGAHWEQTPWLNDGHNLKAIQPTLLDHGKDRIQLLCRTASGKIYQSWSKDAGTTWESLRPTDLPNPNSGIDAVQLQDGRSMLVCNPSSTNRHPLSISFSADGERWNDPMTIEDTDGPELSYPAIIQTADGLVHIAYTWERKRIRHVVVDPTKCK
jgi:predicted neuraminidase